MPKVCDLDSFHNGIIFYSFRHPGKKKTYTGNII